jgi:hypothetical protein
MHDHVNPGYHAPAALSPRPRRTHLCRGNFCSSWRAQGGYGRVAETIFTQAKLALCIDVARETWGWL